MLGYSFLTLVTLGIAGPVGDIAMHRYTMKHTWFGIRKFEFHGRAGAMMGKWMLALVLMPITLGLSLIWYSAFRMRYLASQTRYQGVQFSLPVTFGNLARIILPFYLVLILLVVVIALIIGIAAGIAGYIVLDQSVEQLQLVSHVLPLLAIVIIAVIGPVLQLVMLTHRFIRLVAERLEFGGDCDLDTIMQNAAQRPHSGENLADALDVGGGLEVGI